VFTERTSVGLDVHARSVAAAALDGVTGELVQAKLTPSHEHFRSWLKNLPGPVAVAYEAGPPGSGFSGRRTRPELGASRGDLMRARHRLAKLLLRHGIIYSDGHAWTDKHDAWLRWVGREQLGSPATRLTFESDYDAVLVVKARRDRLDAAIAQMAADSEFTPLVHRLGCLRGIGALPGSRWRSRSATGAGSPARPSAPSSGWSLRSTPRASCGCRDRSPRPATPTCAGCWSKRPGTTAPPTGWARPCAIAGNLPDPAPEPAAMRATDGCTTAGTPCAPDTSGTSWPPSRSPASRWLMLVPGRARGVILPKTASSTTAVAAARGATRDTATSNGPVTEPATLDPRHAIRSSRTARSAVTNPRISA